MMSCIITNSILANNSYFGYSVGDEIDPFNVAKEYDARIYIFTNLNACIACNSSIVEMYNYYSDFYKIEFIIFFQNANQNQIESLEIELPQDIILVNDKKSLYYKYYKVKSQPSYLASSGNGKVLFFDKLAGNNISWEEGKKLFEDNLSVVNKKQKYLNEIERYEVKTHSGEDIYAARQRDMIFSEKKNSFYFIDNHRPILYEIDNMGIIKNISNLYEYGFEAGMILYPSWYIKDSIIFLGIDYQRNGEPIFSLFDINKQVVITKKIHIENEDILGVSSLVISEEYFYTSYDYQKNIAESNSKTILSYNKECEYIGELGNLDFIYYEYDLLSSMDVIFSKDSEKRFFTVQYFSNLVRVYDEKGDEIEVIELELGEKYLPVLQSHPKIISNIKEYWSDFKNNYSMTKNLIVNENDKIILLLYENRDYPPGVIDLYSSEIDRYFYLNVSNFDGENLIGDDILLPPETLPFYISGNILFTTQLVDSKLYIVKYKIAI